MNKPTPDDKLLYILPGNQTVHGQAVRFPFRKELIALDNEATVSTQFFYEGSPYEYKVVEILNNCREKDFRVLNLKVFLTCFKTRT